MIVFKVPTDFSTEALLGQTLYAFLVQKNMLRLDFGRLNSLVDGHYVDYARIEIEEGLLLKFGDRHETFSKNLNARRLHEAAGVLSSLISSQIESAEVVENTKLLLGFSTGAQLTLLVGELESFHVHTPNYDFTV